jgi:DNA invertase Pin-like site-specific DNA recombinase
MSDTVFEAKRRVGRPSRDACPQQIRELRSMGRSFREIARETGFGYGTVRRAYWGIHSATSTNANPAFGESERSV